MYGKHYEMDTVRMTLGIKKIRYVCSYRPEILNDLRNEVDCTLIMPKGFTEFLVLDRSANIRFDNVSVIDTYNLFAKPIASALRYVSMKDKKRTRILDYAGTDEEVRLLVEYYNCVKTVGHSKFFLMYFEKLEQFDEVFKKELYDTLYLNFHNALMSCDTREREEICQQADICFSYYQTEVLGIINLKCQKDDSIS